MIYITPTPNADSRTALQPLDKETLLKNSYVHIQHVNDALDYFVDMIKHAAIRHDWTKIQFIDDFLRDATSGAVGKDFKKLPWFQIHMTQERHHILDRCPEDVTLIDLLERVADTTMAGMERSGVIYDMEIPSEILQLAYKNTITLLKDQIVVTNKIVRAPYMTAELVAKPKGESDV